MSVLWELPTAPMERRLALTPWDHTLVLAMLVILALGSLVLVSSSFFLSLSSLGVLVDFQTLLCVRGLDINECTAGTANCATGGISTCTNTIGSFTCACNTGYSGNGVNCTGEQTPTHLSSFVLLGGFF